MSVPAARPLCVVRLHAAQALPLTGFTHRRIVATVAICAASPGLLECYRWTLEAIGGYALARDAEPRTWWNAVAAAAGLAAMRPGGWLDRWRARRARRDPVPDEDSPRRATVRLGACVSGPSLPRVAWLAWWTTFVAYLLVPLVAWTPVAGGFPTRRTGTELVPPLAILLAWGLLVVVAFRRWGRGRVTVTLPDGALRRGTPAAVHVGVTEGAATIDRARVFVRAHRERPCGPFGWFRVAEPVWTAEAAVEGGRHVGPEREIRVRFDLPAAAPATDLAAPAPVLWDVLVAGTVGGGDFAVRVPVTVR